MVWPVLVWSGWFQNQSVQMSDCLQNLFRTLTSFDYSLFFFFSKTSVLCIATSHGWWASPTEAYNKHFCSSGNIFQILQRELQVVLLKSSDGTLYIVLRSLILWTGRSDRFLCHVNTCVDYMDRWRGRDSLQSSTYNRVSKKEFNLLVMLLVEGAWVLVRPPPPHCSVHS